MASTMYALATPVLPSCGPKQTELTGPRLTARPGAPAGTPTIGVSQLRLPDGAQARLYVPETYSSDTPAPLFIGLHGAGGSSTDWESYYARSEQRGMVFLAPDSSESTWDLVFHGGFGPDARALDEALQYVFERCLIAPGSIALGGFSDGATYSLSLGLSNGDLFSHLVGYSPGFVASAPPTVGTPRIYISHGTGDGIIPISASRTSTVPILQDAGYDVTFEEFDGGHEVPAAISESALDWFFAV